MSRYRDCRVATAQVRQRQLLFCSGAPCPQKVGEPIQRRTNRCPPRRAPHKSYRQRLDRFRSEVFWDTAPLEPSQPLRLSSSLLGHAVRVADCSKKHTVTYKNTLDLCLAQEATFRFPTLDNCFQSKLETLLRC